MVVIRVPVLNKRRQSCRVRLRRPRQPRASRSGAETGTRPNNKHTQPKCKANHLNQNANKKRRLKYGGTREAPPCPPYFFTPPLSVFPFLAYTDFGSFAIVSWDTSPMSAPSSQQVKCGARISRLSVSSNNSIFATTSSPLMSE